MKNLKKYSEKFLERVRKPESVSEPSVFRARRRGGSRDVSVDTVRLSRSASQPKNARRSGNGVFGRVPVNALVFLIKIYQATLSPDHGVFKNIFPALGCRFYPSCSDYAREAISQYGLLTGLMLSLKRIFKCNPCHAGGYDPVRELRIKN